MPMTLEEVLTRCSETVPYGGKKITDVNQKGLFDETPLHVVCTWGEVEPVDLLVRAGANVNAKGERGQTPLFSAVIGRNINVVRTLIVAGADPSIKDDGGKTAGRFARDVGANTLADELEKHSKT